MNTADSQLLASELERMGHRAADDPDDADIFVVNTCVVRQQAEDKAYGRLELLHDVKKHHPDKVIGVMGCLVGVRDPLAIRKRLPYVDVFMPPQPEPPVELTVLQDGTGLRALLIPHRGVTHAPLETGTYEIRFSIDRERWPTEADPDAGSRYRSNTTQLVRL